MTGKGVLGAAAAAVTVGSLVAASAAPAAPVTRNYGNSTPINILDASSVSVPTLASPYPTTLNVSGFVVGSARVVVSINGLTHGAPRDLRIAVGTFGNRVELMGAVGGDDPVANLDLTFAASAPSSTKIPEAGPLIGGLHRPSISSLGLGTYPPPAPAQLGDLSSAGRVANGPWSLYVMDTVPGDTGAIVRGWGLSVTGELDDDFSTGKSKANKNKGSLAIPVTVPGPGILKISKSSRTSGNSLTVTGPSTYVLTAKTRKSATKALNKKGKVKAFVKVTYTPTGGASNSENFKLAFKKTKKKKH